MYFDNIEIQAIKDYIKNHLKLDIQLKDDGGIKFGSQYFYKNSANSYTLIDELGLRIVNGLEESLSLIKEDYLRWN